MLSRSSLVLAAAVLAVAFVVVWTYLPAGGNPVAALVFSTVFSVAMLVIFFRIGFLAVWVAYAAQGVLMFYPMTFDLTVWYAPSTIVAVIVLTALTVYGFRVALAGRSLLGEGALGS
jgi:hypothetical protein